MATLFSARDPHKGAVYQNIADPSATATVALDGIISGVLDVRVTKFPVGDILLGCKTITSIDYRNIFNRDIRCIGEENVIASVIGTPRGIDAITGVEDAPGKAKRTSVTGSDKSKAIAAFDYEPSITRVNFRIGLISDDN